MRGGVCVCVVQDIILELFRFRLTQIKKNIKKTNINFKCHPDLNGYGFSQINLALWSWWVPESEKQNPTLGFEQRNMFSVFRPSIKTHDPNKKYFNAFNFIFIYKKLYTK